MALLHAIHITMPADHAGRHQGTSSSPRSSGRKHASRTCLACRKRKTRCLLANTHVGSSMTPLPDTDKCEHCRSNELPCVVWDGNRKSKRYTSKSSMIQERMSSLDTNGTEGVQFEAESRDIYSPNSLDTNLEHAEGKSTRASTSLGEVAPNTFTQRIKERAEQVLSPFVPVWPTLTSRADDLSSHPYSRVSDESYALQRDLGSPIMQHAQSTETNASWIMEEARDPRTLEKSRQHSKRESLALYHCPLAITVQLLEQLDSKESKTPHPTIDTRALSGNDDEDLSQLLESIVLNITMSSHCPAFEATYIGLLVFHPHLPPSLFDLLQVYRRETSVSTAFLLALVLQLCCVELVDQSSFQLIRILLSLGNIVDVMAAHILLHLPRHIQAAQALEILAVHHPFLSKNRSSYTDCGLVPSKVLGKWRADSAREAPPGSAYLAGAIAISRALGIPNMTCDAVLSCRSKEKCSAGSCCALWMSLSCWDACLSINDGNHCGSALDVSSAQTECVRASCHITSSREEQGEEQYGGNREDGSRAFDACRVRRERLILRAGLGILLARSELMLATITLRRQLEENVLLQDDVAGMQKVCHESFSQHDMARRRLIDDILLFLDDICASETDVDNKSDDNVSLIQQLEEWLSIEAAALHAVAASIILCVCHRWRLRWSSGSLITSWRIHNDLAWANLSTRYGHIRFEASQLILAHASRLQGATGCKGDGLTWPPILTAAYIVFASKCIVDMQINIIDGWGNVSEHTPSLIAHALQTSSVFRESASVQIHLPTSHSQFDRRKIWQDMAEILKITADLLQSWQRGVRLARAIKGSQKNTESLLASDDTSNDTPEEVDRLLCSGDITSSQSIPEEASMPALHQLLNADFLSDFPAANDILALLNDPIMY